MNKTFIPTSTYTVVVKHPPTVSPKGLINITRIFLSDEANVHMVIDYCMHQKLGVAVRAGMKRGKGIDVAEQRRASIIFSAAKTFARERGEKVL